MRSLKRPSTSGRLSALLSISTALLLLNGCARVAIVDHEWCGDVGTQGAICFHTLTEETSDIPKPAWDDMRFGQICTNDPEGSKGETFADWKSVIEKLCSVSGRCTYSAQKKIQAFFDRADRFQARATELDDTIRAQAVPASN